MRFALTLALLVTTAPALAFPIATDSFRDPATGFRVEITHTGNDMVLDGVNPLSHERLHLVVTARGHVTGVYKGQPVDYVTGQRAAADAVVAAN